MHHDNEREHLEEEGREAKGEGGTRPQQAGEAETTRLGMEDGDNTDISTVGGPSDDDETSSS